MKATLTYSAVAGGSAHSTAYLNKVSSLDLAEAIGHGLTGAQSIAANMALYLAGVTLDNGDFTILPPPSHLQDGVDVSDHPFAEERANYRVLGPHATFMEEFASDNEASNWQMGFTDGPDIYPLEKLIGDVWHGWNMEAGAWQPTASR